MLGLNVFKDTKETQNPTLRCTRVEWDSIPTKWISHFHCSDHKQSRTCSNNLEQSENVEPNTTKSRNLWYCHRTKLTSRAGNNVYYSIKMEHKECSKLLIRIGHKKSGGVRGGGGNKSFEEEMFHRTWPCWSLVQFPQYDRARGGEKPYHDSGVSGFISFVPRAPQNSAYPYVILYNFQASVFDFSKWKLC